MSVIVSVFSKQLDKLNIDLPVGRGGRLVQFLRDHFFDLCQELALQFLGRNVFRYLANAEQVGSLANIQLARDAHTIYKIESVLAFVRPQTSAHHLRVKACISCRSGDDDRFDQGHISTLSKDHAVHKTGYLTVCETLDDLRTILRFRCHHNSTLDKLCDMISVLYRCGEDKRLTDSLFIVGSCNSFVL